jgi:hypothetical protein
MNNERFYLIDAQQEKITNEDIEETSLQRVCKLIPALIDSVFGSGNESDGYKVSRDYYFRNNKTDEIVTLYDWKMTTLYDPEYFRPSEFWQLDEPTTFNIGAKDHANTYGFVRWLESKLK